MEGTKLIIAVLFSWALIFGAPGYLIYNYFQDKQEKADKQQDVANGFGCESFEDCLGKYKFEGAYHYYAEIDGEDDPESKEVNFKKLISAQVNFWCGQKDFEKAYSILNEYTMVASYNLQTDDESANDKYNDEAGFMNSQMEFIIIQMLVCSQPKAKILKYAKSLKPIVVGNEDDTSIFGGYNSYVLSNQPYDDAVTKIKKK
jgi:hypothetical protein